MGQNENAMNHPAFDRIRSKLQTFAKKGYRLLPTLTSAEVEQFEAKVQIRLPEAYRQFLMHVGNGVGSATGDDLDLDRAWLMPLSQSWQHMEMPVHECLARYLAEPCCLTPEMNAPLIWQEFLASQRIVDDQNWENETGILGRGMVAICYHGCSFYNTLVVSGPYAGRVVYFDLEANCPPWFAPEPDFLSWFERQIDEVSQGAHLDYHGWGPPGDEEAVLVASGEFPQAVILRALFRFSSLSEASWTHVQNSLNDMDETVQWLGILHMQRLGAPSSSCEALKAIVQSGREPYLRMSALEALSTNRSWTSQNSEFFMEIAKTDSDVCCRSQAERCIHQIEPGLLKPSERTVTGLLLEFFGLRRK